MKAKELIELLKEVDGDLRVVSEVGGVHYAIGYVTEEKTLTTSEGKITASRKVIIG